MVDLPIGKVSRNGTATGEKSANIKPLIQLYIINIQADLKRGNSLQNFKG